LIKRLEEVFVPYTRAMGKMADESGVKASMSKWEKLGPLTWIFFLRARKGRNQEKKGASEWKHACRERRNWEELHKCGRGEAGISLEKSV